MGALPSGTTTAVAEWLPRHVFAGAPAEAAPGETRLSEVRRLTAGLEVTATAFDATGESLYFVASPRGGGRGGLYRVALSRRTPSLDGAAERLTAEGDDVTTIALGRLAAGGERVLIRAGGAWTERTPEVTRAVDLPAAEFVVFAGASAVVLGLPAEPGGVRTVSFPRLDGRPAGVQEVAGAPAAWSGPFARQAPAVSSSGALLALAAPDPACGRADGKPARDPKAPRDGKASGEAACDVARSIALFSREGRGRRELIDVSPHRLAGLAFLRGDDELCFASDRDRSSFELYAVSARDRSVERLTFAGGRAASVSPDGGRLAFASQRAGDTADLYIARLGERSAAAVLP